MPPKIIKKIGIIVFKDKKILMARSNKNADVFYFPGGKFETGESDIDCLQRESKEELGTTAKPESIKFLSEFEDVAHGKETDVKLNIKLYECELVSEPEASSEIEEIKYFDSSVDPKHLDIIGGKIFSWLKENNYIN